MNFLLQKLNNGIRGTPGFPHIGEPDGVNRSAAELYEAGIRFRLSNSSNLRDIQLDRACRIKIVVDNSTECMYLNLRAFCELLHFPHRLGQGRQPAALAGHHPERGGQLATRLWGRSSTICPRTQAAASIRKVHCESTRRANSAGRASNTWQANLIQTYFRSPWSPSALLSSSTSSGKGKKKITLRLKGASM